MTVWLLYQAALASFGPTPALVTGLVTASSTALLMLSTSLNNETPYLLLVAVTFLLWKPLRPLVAAWGGLHALACLFRVEHALFFVLASLFLVGSWLRHGSATSSLRMAGVFLFFFGLVLAPWHVSAWRAVRRFNAEPLPADRATEQAMHQVESLVAGLRWEPEARHELHKMPAAGRRAAGNFVAATVAVRGGSEVTRTDFQILQEAFGATPRSLRPFPFVALYGGLNFYLANNRQAPGGFSRSPLEAPPPLSGGAGRYPFALIQGLPPPQLALTYPPHLEAVNEGYRLGWDWIREHPGNYLRLAWRKLQIFWQGAALGFAGYNLPLGLCGVRRTVDLAVPTAGSLPSLWRLALLVVALLGVFAARRRFLVVPWLLFLISKVLVTIVFFGYARQGASVVPVIGLLAGLALERGTVLRAWTPRLSSLWRRAGPFLIGGALIALETLRWAAGPELLLDGKRVGVTDPFPVTEYVSRTLEVK